MKFCWLAVCIALVCPAIASDQYQQLLTDAKSMQSWLVGIRRELHQHPELLFEEFNTSAAIREHLDKLGIPYKYGASEVIS